MEERLNGKQSKHLERTKRGFDVSQPKSLAGIQARKMASFLVGFDIDVEDKENEQPAATLKAKKRKQPAAAGPSNGAKKAMMLHNVQELTKTAKTMEERISAADKLRAHQETNHHEFRGCSVKEIARSQKVAERVKAMFKVKEAQYHAACVACDDAEEAYRRELARQDQHHVAELDKGEARTSAGSASEEQLAKDKQEESQEPVLESTEPRYPRRQRPEVNYVEPELLDEDEYLFCDRCQLEYQGVCPTHGKLQFVVDRHLPNSYKDPDRAERTLPLLLAVAESSVKGAGLGAWTRVPLDEGVVFGPYEGVRSRAKRSSGEKPSGYSWIIKRKSKAVAEVDAADSSKSNWLRYVNCAATKTQYNVSSFQFQTKVYYRTLKKVPAHSELMVYYGDSYARELGIDTRGFHRGLELLAPPAIFSCSLCNIGFTSPIRRDRHQRLYCRRRRFDEPVKTTLAYEEHLAKEIPKAFELSAKFNEPGPERRKRFKCADCTFSCDFNSHLKQHLLTHTGERRFPCTMCEYKATQKGALNRHLLTHGDVKLYACTMCNYRAARNGDLATHLRLHTGEKPFQCTQCDFSSNQKATLTNHVRAKHTKERRFGCTQCEFTSVNSNDLRKHIMKQHKR